MTLPAANEAIPKTVLVVEDEFLLAMDMKDALTGAGFRVLGPAGSVDHALDLLEAETPNAAVLDVTLGSEKVTPVALQLKSLGIPFVLATASDTAEISRYEVLATVPNLGKPTDMARLIKTVRGIITRALC